MNTPVPIRYLGSARRDVTLKDWCEKHFAGHLAPVTVFHGVRQHATATTGEPQSTLTDGRRLRIDKAHGNHLVYVTAEMPPKR